MMAMTLAAMLSLVSAVVMMVWMVLLHRALMSAAMPMLNAARGEISIRVLLDLKALVVVLRATPMRGPIPCASGPAVY